MSLSGLPDFQQSLQVDELQLFAPYSGGDYYFLMPDKLEIATRPDASPDFLLELVRGRNPALPPEPHGILDFRVVPRYQMAQGLDVIRTRDSRQASLSPISFSSGFLRFQPPLNLDNSLLALQKPLPLAWNGLGIARFYCQLSQSAATLIKSSLQGEVLALNAVAELEMIGVSPRLPLKVSFNPAQLLQALLALGNAERLVARKAIANFFRSNWQSLPLHIEGELGDRSIDDFAQALTDRVRGRFGTFVPAPTLDAGAHIALVSPSEIGSGRFEWDLAQPISVPRSVTLYLNPWEAVVQIVQKQGTQGIVLETTVPPIPTGFQSVKIVANLPTIQVGILAIGVTIRVNPKPPLRPQAQVETVELQAFQNTPQINLRFAAKEEAQYSFCTYVIVKDAKGIAQIDGEVKLHRGNRLYLSSSDFPVDFVPVTASRQLLELATISVSCYRVEDAATIQEQFELNFDQPTITFALPKGTNDATLEISAHSRQGLGSINLGMVSAQPLQLDLYSFREYGLQKVEVECIFEQQKQPIVFEFLPESYSEIPQNIQLLFFQPNQTKKLLTWVTSSLFQYRYRYRQKPLASTTNSLPEWSDYLSPFEPLKIQV
jgi:hypothetical protein